MSALSQNINKTRLEQGLSQDKLAEKLNVTGNIILSWENGEAEPSIDMLVNIAEALNTDVSTLINSRPLPSKRKKNIKQLLIACGILTIIGIIALILDTKIKQQYIDYMDFSIFFVLRFYVYPALFLMSGWTYMQILGVLGIAKPAHLKYSKNIYIVVLIIVLLYAIILLPYTLDSLYNTAKMFESIRRHYSFSRSSHIPEIFGIIAAAVVHKISPIMFLVPGTILWITKPLRSK